MFRIYHIPPPKLLMRYNRETDRNKSAQYKVRSRRNKWLLLITENLQKKSYQFLKYARVRPEVRYAPGLALPPALG